MSHVGLGLLQYELAVAGTQGGHRQGPSRDLRVQGLSPSLGIKPGLPVPELSLGPEIVTGTTTALLGRKWLVTGELLSPPHPSPATSSALPRQTCP